MSLQEEKKGSRGNQEALIYHISFRWSVREDSKENDDIVHGFCLKYFDKFIYQLENPRTDGVDNLHYQGYGHLLIKLRPGAIKKAAISLNGSLNGIEMSAASTAGVEALRTYCLKAETKIRGPWADGSRYLGEDLITALYPWQQEIKDEVAGPVNDRTINVIVDEVGNIGKSAFCKYMAWHFKAPVCGWAKTGDILNLVSQMPNRSLYLFDLSRARPQDWARDDVCAAMEGIKNGLFVNTKYQVCQVIMKSPHIWMFTNQVPNISAMSADRWRLWEVSGNQLVRLSRRRRNRSPSPARILVD